jgi:hypothetical protein
MPTRTSYAHGTPSWIDLSTTDPAAARAFYGELFGWLFEANPVDGGGEYVMASLADGPVAGLMQQPPEQAEMGLPSMWSTYVTVDDVDATASKVGGAGGSVMAQPFDVMDAGRMAVIVDPAGAVLCLWQANDHIGAHVVNEPGSLVWTELISNDLDASSRFYTALLGWGIEPMEMGPDQPPYSVYTVAGEGIAGGMHPPMEGMPSFWGIYFATGDCDATVAKAESLGATVIAAPMDLPVGRMAALQDPTGAMFSVIAMAAPEE